MGGKERQLSPFARLPNVSLASQHLSLMGYDKELISGGDHALVGQCHPARWQALDLGRNDALSPPYVDVDRDPVL